MKLLSKSFQKISLEVNRGHRRSLIARIYHIGSNLRSLIKKKMSKRSNSDFYQKLSLEQSWSSYLGRPTAEQEAKEILSTMKSSEARGFKSLAQPSDSSDARDSRFVKTLKLRFARLCIVV